jgi:hypothetical protein
LHLPALTEEQRQPHTQSHPTVKSIHPKNVISTEATDSFIVRRAVERSLYFLVSTTHSSSR